MTGGQCRIIAQLSEFIHNYKKNNPFHVFFILENSMSFQLSAIDDDELIHRAVREGHCISLEVYLNQNPNCINKLFTCGKFIMEHHY